MTFKSMTVLAVCAALHSFARAEIDNTTPYIDPQRDCLTEGMNNPEGKDYRYLYSRDCRVVYVLPPPAMSQNIRAEGVNLSACNAMKLAQNAIGLDEKMVDDAKQRLANYEDQLDKARTKDEEQRLQRRIRELNDRLEGYKKVRDESVAAFNKNYGPVPGAVFSVALQGDVTQTDLNQLRGLNLANLHRTKTVIVKSPDAGGKDSVYQIAEDSSLRVAPVSSSIYSFIYNVPDRALENGGIISTDIPGLEYLQQENSNRTGVLHIRANGGVSGKVIMSLTTACDHVKNDERGKPIIDADTNPFFTVNRTFEVQQMFAQGYEARLKVDKVAKQISKYIMTGKGEGAFQKSSVFNNTINANVTDILDFQWTTEFDDKKQISWKEVYDIKTAVATKLVDDYVERLVKENLIKIEPTRSLTPAEGGYTDDTRHGTRCWSERNGGLSGLFGGSHQVCGDYTYVVKVWHDGVTEEDLNRNLTLDGETIDKMQANMMTPFYYSTSFTK